MKRIALGLTLLASCALAAGLKYSLVVNGQVAPDQAIVVNGQTFVRLCCLNRVGVG